MSLIELYPLKFHEIYKEKPWGGLRLASLGKDIPSGKLIGESWEISDHPEGQSRVRTGALKDKTISELMAEYGSELLGSEIVPDNRAIRFPLLIKFLDIGDTISLQVHPDEAAAKEFGEESSKREAWYVLGAEENAHIFCGLGQKTTIKDIEDALNPDQPLLVQNHKLRPLLNSIRAQKGNVINIPAGTIHSAEGGILLAEIQENSDVTYRIFDWGRVGEDGKPRELHTEKAFASIKSDPEAGIAQMRRLQNYAYDRYMLVENDKFMAELIYASDFASEITEPHSPKRFHILMIIAGSGELEYQIGKVRRAYTPLNYGETILVPASLGDYIIHGSSLQWLKITPAINIAE